MVEMGSNNYKMEVLTEWKNEGGEEKNEKNEKGDEDNGAKNEKEKEKKDMNKVEEEEEEKEKKEKKGEEKTEGEKIKEKEEKAEFHQQEVSPPRLPCSGSSWCNILCGAQHQSHFLSDGQKSPKFLSDGPNANSAQKSPKFLSDGPNANSAPKSPKSPQFNGAFQLDEAASHIYANKACDLWIPSYEFQSGPVSNTEILLDEAFKPNQSFPSRTGGIPICGSGEGNAKNMKAGDTGKEEEEKEDGLLYVTEV